MGCDTIALRMASIMSAFHPKRALARNGGDDPSLPIERHGLGSTPKTDAIATFI